MDPKVNGQLQSDWSWLIAAYLFLGGVGSGAYVTAVIEGFARGADSLATQVGLWVSFPAVLIGTLFLLADLGSPAKAVLAGMKVGTSWIARGFWIISIFMVLAFLHLVLSLSSSGSAGLVSTISVLGVLFALGTMAYTGILLGASKGIPFWRTGAVPVVFVVSALATGHFTVMLGMVIFGGGGEALKQAIAGDMVALAAVLVVFEVLAIFLFLQAAFRQPDSRESALRILRRTTFVVGYILLGLIAPLVIMAWLFFGLQQAGAGGFLALAALGALLGLIGGLLLRHGVLICGALPTWNIAGFQFRRIPKPKDPKPDMGLLPPQ